MTQTIGVWNSGFRLIIWLPLNNNKWFDRHSVAKKKKEKENKSKKQTKKKKNKKLKTKNQNKPNNCTNMCFSLRDQSTPASALCTDIALGKN